MISVISEQKDIPQNLPVVLIFSATWCGPCRLMAPLLETVAKEYEGKVRFLKVDLDQSQDLAAKYEIQAVPTMVLLENVSQGDTVQWKEKGRRVGQKTSTEIREWIKADLPLI